MTTSQVRSTQQWQGGWGGGVKRAFTVFAVLDGGKCRTSC